MYFIIRKLFINSKICNNKDCNDHATQCFVSVAIQNKNIDIVRTALLIFIRAIRLIIGSIVFNRPLLYFVFLVLKPLC